MTIFLRPLESKDIDAFMVWATDDEVTKSTTWVTYTSRNEAEKFFENIIEKHPWFKAICLNGNVIGSMTLTKGKGSYSCTAELGYVLARKHWGNGFTTQSVNLAIQTGFNDLDVQRIEAYVDPINKGSQRVLEKNGFVKEGLLRKSIICKGLVKDRFVYSFINSNEKAERNLD